MAAPGRGKGRVPPAPPYIAPRLARPNVPRARSRRPPRPCPSPRPRWRQQLVWSSGSATSWRGGTSRRSCSCATRRSLRGPSRRRGSRWAPATNSQITITAAGTGAGSRCRPWWWRRRREPCQRGHRPAVQTLQRQQRGRSQ